MDSDHMANDELAKLRSEIERLSFENRSLKQIEAVAREIWYARANGTLRADPHWIKLRKVLDIP